MEFINNNIMVRKPQHVALIQEIVNSGTMVRIRITGKSMEPCLVCGDIVTVKKVSPDSLKPGDLLFYISPYKVLVLHRLIEKNITPEGAVWFHTKGDALGVFDAPFKESSVIGKVCLVEKRKAARTVDLERVDNRVRGYLSAYLQKWKTTNKRLTWPACQITR